MNVLTMREDSCLVDLMSKIIMEVGVDKSKTWLSPMSDFSLPDKLGELLSSTCLLGALQALAEMRKFKSLKAYGLLVLRCALILAVQLEVSIQSVNILWANSDQTRFEVEL